MSNNRYACCVSGRGGLQANDTARFTCVYCTACMQLTPTNKAVGVLLLFNQQSNNLISLLACGDVSVYM
jgi:ribosomal protein S26